MAWCNAYGAENAGGVGTPFGGFLANPVAVQPVCKTPAAHRFTWVCECGHSGQPVSLCEQHYAEFSGQTEFRSNVSGRRQPVPYNVRRDVQACPRCASMAATPELQHKCAVRLVTVS
jgi:hypothetical protein